MKNLFHAYNKMLYYIKIRILEQDHNFSLSLSFSVSERKSVSYKYEVIEFTDRIVMFEIQ